ncbi:MAG: TetR/AcrR family transcriptional regulator [Egibacteraceae bacterium]
MNAGTPKASTSPARRARARRGEGGRLREEILAVAERLLIETGDGDAVSIRAVANAAGVTPPSIYLHFADKTELLFQVCQMHWRRFDDHLRRAIEGIDDPLERLRACGRAYVRFGVENPEHYRILFMAKPKELPPGADMEEQLRISGFTRLYAAVDEAIARDRLAGDPMLITFHAWSVVHGVTSLLISLPNVPWPDRDVLVDHLIETTLHGLAPARSPGEAPA